MQDLEIRGAGEVLGDAQSGDIQDIGFNLFTDMLNHAVRALKAGKEPDLSQPLGVTTEINLHVPALLPATYSSDVHERLSIYKRLANCETEDALTAMHEELVDRFGIPPEQTQALLESHRLRILSRRLGIVRVDATADAIVLQFDADTAIDPARIIQLIQTQRGWRLQGSSKLRVERASATLKERAQGVRDVLRQLSPEVH